jgi:hypothetical protein
VSDARDDTRVRLKGLMRRSRANPQIIAWRERLGAKVQLTDAPLLLAKLQLPASAAHTRTPFFYTSSSSLLLSQTVVFLLTVSLIFCENYCQVNE